jgi:multiple sugar transport system substrate-binding protein
MWGMTGRGSPARTSAWDSYFKSKYAPANARVVLDSLNSFASNEILFQPTTPKVTNTAKAIWDRVDAGQLPVKDALDQLVQQLNPILAANK